VSELKQTIRYCKAANGMAIAWATIGSGPPVVVSSAGGQHLEVYFRNAVSRPWIEGLARGHTLIRYDGLGSGLSDRNFRQFSLENSVADLEAVADAAGATNFALFAQSWGAHAAIAYAARHPNRVERLVLYGASARGLFRGNPSAERMRIREASFAAIRAGWDADPAFRALHAMQFSPVGTAEELRAYVEMMAANPGETMVEMLRWIDESDVSEEAASIRCPTLVMHATRDPRVPFEEGPRLASLIPGSHFVPVDSPNHFCMPSELAFEGVLTEILQFIGGGRTAGSDTAFADLTPRERDVLDLIARGLDNLQIAAHLNISEKTVRNNITPIFDKLGVENRAQAIVKAREAGMGKAK